MKSIEFEYQETSYENGIFGIFWIKFALRWTRRIIWHSPLFLQVLKKVDRYFDEWNAATGFRKAGLCFKKKSDHFHNKARSVNEVWDAGGTLSRNISMGRRSADGILLIDIAMEEME